MEVICDKCELEYDDTYHYTNCPHEYFEMHCVATNESGETKCCHTIEELDEHLKGNNPKEKRRPASQTVRKL